MVVFFVLPVMELVRLSLYAQLGAGFAADFWSPGNYLRFLEEPTFRNVLWRTVEISAIVTVLDLVIGYPVAYVMARGNPRLSSALYLLIVSPLLVSLVVRTYGWMAILGPKGLVNNLLGTLGVAPASLLYNQTGAVIGMTHVLLPFMVLSIWATIQGVDPNLEQAAATLGAHPWRAFLAVTLPLSAPGVAAGSLIVFALTMSSYVTPIILGGAQGRLMAALVADRAIGLNQWNFAAAVSIIFLVASVVFVVVHQRAERELGRGEAWSRGG